MTSKPPPLASTPATMATQSSALAVSAPSRPSAQIFTQSAPASSLNSETSSVLVEFRIAKNLDVTAHLDGSLLVLPLVLLLSWLFFKHYFLRRTGREFELNEAEFGIGQQKIKLKPNDDDRQIAYQIWVELSTRKIGLPIDLKQDVITEIYDSWHTFFSVTRELIKDVPVRKYQRNSTAKIVGLSIEVLNEGLRPHLTKWQARFRRWYQHAAEKDVSGNTAPQEIQKEFPAFAELTEDLTIVNKRLIAYRRRMHELIMSRDDFRLQVQRGVEDENRENTQADVG